MKIVSDAKIMNGRLQVSIDIQDPEMELDEKKRGGGGGGKPGRGGGAGRWVTIMGRHVFIGRDGVPRAGPNGPKVDVDRSDDGPGGGGQKPESKPKPEAEKPKPKPESKPAEKPKHEDEKPKPKPEAEKPTAKSKSKVSGNKEEAGKLLDGLSDADKSFGGNLSKFLEKHPIKEVRVGKTDSTNQSSGVYNKGTGVLAVKPTTNTGFLMYDKGVEVAADHASKHGDDPKAYQQAVFLHEVGHHVLLTAIAKIPGAQKALYADNVVKAYQSDKKKVSGYADSQPHEYFAECFSAYHHNPKSLSKEARTMVEAVLAAGV